MPKVEASAVSTASPKMIEVFNMRAVHGLLIHPYTQARFVTDKDHEHVKDLWCEIQIEAGKLKIV